MYPLLVFDRVGLVTLIFILQESIPTGSGNPFQ